MKFGVRGLDTSDHLNISQLDKDFPPPNINNSNAKNLPKILEEVQGEERHSTPAVENAPYKKQPTRKKSTLKSLSSFRYSRPEKCCLAFISERVIGFFCTIYYLML